MKLYVRCHCGYFALFCLCEAHKILVMDAATPSAMGKCWIPLLSGLDMKPSSTVEEQCWSALFAKIEGQKVVSGLSHG